ncbi:MAG: hypothetical protein K2H24_06445 [Clostridia bacterium]|nr:hypothetical protein [Clostridia bacterium]
MSLTERQLLDLNKNRYQYLLNVNECMTKIFSAVFVYLGAIVTAFSSLFTVYCNCGAKKGISKVAIVFFVIDLILAICSFFVNTKGVFSKTIKGNYVAATQKSNAISKSGKDMKTENESNSNTVEKNSTPLQNKGEQLQESGEKDIIAKEEVNLPKKVAKSKVGKSKNTKNKRKTPKDGRVAERQRHIVQKNGTAEIKNIEMPIANSSDALWQDEYGNIKGIDIKGFQILARNEEDLKIIEQYRNVLKNYKISIDDGISIIDKYNESVRKQSERLAEYEKTIKEHKDTIENYEETIEKHNNLINEYENIVVNQKKLVDNYQVAISECQKAINAKAEKENDAELLNIYNTMIEEVEEKIAKRRKLLKTSFASSLIFTAFIVATLSIFRLF